MHNAYMQVYHNLVHLVCNPRRDRVHLVEYNTRSMRPRRDYNRC